MTRWTNTLAGPGGTAISVANSGGVLGRPITTPTSGTNPVPGSGVAQYSSTVQHDGQNTLRLSNNAYVYWDKPAAQNDGFAYVWAEFTLAAAPAVRTALLSLYRTTGGVSGAASVQITAARKIVLTNGDRDPGAGTSFNFEMDTVIPVGQRVLVEAWFRADAGPTAGIYGVINLDPANKSAPDEEKTQNGTGSGRPFERLYAGSVNAAHTSIDKYVSGVGWSDVGWRDARPTAIVIQSASAVGQLLVVVAGRTNWVNRQTAGTTGAAGWSVRQPAGCDGRTDWPVRATAGTSGTTGWPVRAAAGRLGETTWGVRQAAATAGTTGWQVAVLAAADGTSSWLLRQAATVDGATAWPIGQLVVAAGRTDWDVQAMGVAGITGETSWAVRVVAGPTGRADWAVAVAAGAVGVTGWDLHQLAGGGGETAWAAYTAAAAHGATGWVVRATAGSPGAAGWVVFAAAGVVGATAWSVRVAANSDGATVWAVESITPGSSGATTWAVRVTATASGATSWAVRIPADVADGATAWVLLVLAAATGRAGWAVRRTAGATGRTVWDVGAVLPAPPPPYVTARPTEDFVSATAGTSYVTGEVPWAETWVTSPR